VNPRAQRLPASDRRRLADVVTQPSTDGLSIVEDGEDYRELHYDYEDSAPDIFSDFHWSDPTLEEWEVLNALCGGWVA